MSGRPIDSARKMKCKHFTGSFLRYMKLRPGFPIYVWVNITLALGHCANERELNRSAFNENKLINNSSNLPRKPFRHRVEHFQQQRPVARNLFNADIKGHFPEDEMAISILCDSARRPWYKIPALK
jgi:hypothetical protein